MQLDDVHKLLEAVARGGAVALVPRSAAGKEQARGLRSLVPATAAVWEVSVAWPAHVRPSAAVRALLASLPEGDDRSG
jgi:DNA-binding transcriptional LysR family regulator